MKWVGILSVITAVIAGALGAAVLVVIVAMASANARSGDAVVAIAVVCGFWVVTLAVAIILVARGMTFAAAGIAVLPMAALVGLFLYTGMVVKHGRAASGTSAPSDLQHLTPPRR